MLGVDDGGYTAHLLGLGDGVDGQGGLTRGFGTVDLDDASAGITAHAQGIVQADGACGDDLDVLDVVVAQLHDRPAAESFAYLVHSHLQGFEFLGRDFLALRLVVFTFLVDDFFCHFQ